MRGPSQLQGITQASEALQTICKRWKQGERSCGKGDAEGWRWWQHLLGGYWGQARGLSIHGRKHVLLLGGLLRLPGGSPGHGRGLGSGLLPARLRLRCARAGRSLGLPAGLRLHCRSCRCSLGLPCRLRRLGHCLYGTTRASPTI